MKLTKLLMGMPITVEIIDAQITNKVIEHIFSYFTYIDETFSTYKRTSEIAKINNGTLQEKNASKDIQTIFALSEKTKRETNGYFDIVYEGKYDPSGIVKGWAIYNASLLLQQQGFMHYYIEAGGDIQVCGKNAKHKKWRVGIKNPFQQNQIVKVVCLTNKGIATSGTYIRGQHIYNPKEPAKKITDIVSLTVIGVNVYEADRFATAAFAMGQKGIDFIEKLQNFEGYMIDKDGIATMTSGFEQYQAIHGNIVEKIINYI